MVRSYKVITKSLRKCRNTNVSYLILQIWKSEEQRLIRRYKWRARSAPRALASLDVALSETTKWWKANIISIFFVHLHEFTDPSVQIKIKIQLVDNRTIFQLTLFAYEILAQIWNRKLAWWKLYSGKFK